MAFKDIISQKKAKEIIAGQIVSGKVPHAYLFLGADGVGRKKTALELAKALNCAVRGAFPDPCDHCLSCRKTGNGLHPDVQIIDFAWQAKRENKDVEKQKAIKIDTIRALQHEISLKPSEGKWKIFIIEPAEKITPDAANCLLKTLEEPPVWTVLILLARHKENLPATVVSRTQVVMFQPLREKEVASFLKSRTSLASEHIEAIARASEGSLAQALTFTAEKDVFPETLWRDLKNDAVSMEDVFALSQRHARNAAAFLDGLLAQAKIDFRGSPARFQPVIESIIYSQRLLEKNVNPQMILDVLLLKLRHQVQAR